MTAPASHLHPAISPTGATPGLRARLEPLPPMPLRKGRCDWCGKRCRRGIIYCSPACRVAYNNLLSRQGKSLTQLLKVWRLHRGGRDTPGAGKLSLIAARVDAAAGRRSGPVEIHGEGSLMAEVQYDPPEDKIADVIARTGGDPRKLAIAYLRAQKRARDAETSFKLMNDLQDFTVSGITGDMAGARKATDRFKRRLQTHSEHFGGREK